MKPKRPNILLIMSDQHHAGVMGCAGDAIAETPNIIGTWFNFVGPPEPDSLWFSESQENWVDNHIETAGKGDQPFPAGDVLKVAPEDCGC